MRALGLSSVWLLLIASCGDGAPPGKTCGPGTADTDDDGICEAECGTGTEDMDGDGVCEPIPITPTCTDGTILDMATNTCVIDPASCQGGTVLINGNCVDPTEGLAIDLNEGAEPNDDGGAGTITLKPAGQAFVVKGKINPYRDDNTDGEPDPDYDVYVLTVTAPTLIDISVDGVNGLMGAFIAFPGTDPVASTEWIRYGVNVMGDTSRRDVYFPAAGTYVIGVGDTRSLYLNSGSPPATGAGAAAGGPNATYFMSLTVKAMPTPTPLTLTNGAAQATGMLSPGAVNFYLADTELGINRATLDVPGTPNGALVVANGAQFKTTSNEDFDQFGPRPATTQALGFKTGDQALIVVDTTYHYGPGEASYTLDVNAGTAAALSTIGGTAMQPESASDFSAFYYDVANADDVLGFALTFDQPVSGLVLDENLGIFARFTFGTDGSPTGRTFTSYTGLMRHQSAGRYYFMVFEPAAAGATDITATSTIAAQTVTTVVKGTPLTNQTVDTTYQSNAFMYDAGTAEVWHVFNAVGTGTGNLTNAYFEPSTAYGRLDALTTGGTGTIVNDVTPIFTHTFPAAGAAQGRVLLADDTTTYLVTTNTATVGGTPTFTLDFKPRTYVDYGTLAAGDAVTRNGETLTPAAHVTYYLLRTAAGNMVDVQTDPVDVALDTRIQLLDRDETVRRTVNNAVAGQDDILQGLQSSTESWTAFAISQPTAVTSTLTYNLTAGAATYMAPTYTAATPATTYSDACTGGTTQTLVADGSGNGPANDEGFASSLITTPTGFTFFGFEEPSFRASTNGWLTFGATTTALFANQDMPLAGGPNGVVAPFWDDLENVTICTKTAGTTLTIQWTGNRFLQAAQTVAFQAILDAADQSITFVYGATHVPAGAGQTATVGIEDQLGTAAHEIGFNTANTTPASTAIQLTPM